MKLINADLSGFSVQNTLWGFDVLAGVVYNQPMYDVYFKAGAPMENSQVKFSTGSLSNISSAVTGNATVNISSPIDVVTGGLMYRFA